MTRSRATSWTQLDELLAYQLAREDEAYDSFNPRATDVIISPFPKCGTTWLQQIVHGLRTGGDMDFTDICQVVPWIAVAPTLGIDLNVEQRASPRVFMAHRPWHDLPRGCRYIVAFRNPKDAAVSFYRFMEGWFLEAGAIPIDDILTQPMYDPSSKYNYWDHAASWLAQRGNPDVLLLTFENMKQDLPGVVQHIAGFLSIDSDRSIDIATRQATFEFMSAHSDCFALPLIRSWVEEHVGLTADSETSTRVRRGQVGANRAELRPSTADQFDEIWRATIGMQFPYPTYEDLVSDLEVHAA